MTLATLVTGDGIAARQGGWEFNATVAQTFDSHVNKSVPFYADTQKLAVDLSDWFLQGEESTVYDIGCATGTTILELMARHPEKDVRYIGLDRSEAMIAQALARVQGWQTTFFCADALEYAFSPANLIYCLYTLQFIHPSQRLQLCQILYGALCRRGALILVEKVLDEDSMLGDIYTHVHWSMKEENGFCPSEIYGKAQSLRGVLTPFTFEENISLLREAGFGHVSVFFKWCNFAGLIAVK